MIASLFISAVFSLACSAGGEVFESIVVRFDQLAERGVPDRAAPVEGLIRLYQRVAETLGLTAYVSPSPPIVLFGPDDREDAEHLLELLCRATTTFRETYGFEEHAEVPQAAFWLRSRDGYGSLIDDLAEKERYLESWSSEAKSINGFAIYRPELVCVVEGPSSRMGLNLENNLVHLTGHLLLGQYAGNQPFWVREGVGLDLESRVLGTVYGFCAAGRLAPMSRRGGWSRQLAAYWHQKSTLESNRLTELTQNRLDHDAALLAMSIVRYLTTYHLDGFKAFLRNIAEEIDTHLHEDLYYKVPPSRQEEMLAAILGSRWRDDALATMRSRSVWTRGDADSRGVSVAHTDDPMDNAAPAATKKLLAWSGNRRRLDGIAPVRLEAIEQALAPWAAWCQRSRYHGLLGKDGKVLLLVSEKRRKVSSDIRWVDKVCDLVDEKLLCRSTASAAMERTGDLGEEAREDCIILVEFRTEDDYRAALEVLGEEYPYDSAALSALEKSTGFILFNPLAGGWLESAPGVEQWKPENELINRLTRLMIVREYGRLPAWVLAGSAWYAELELTSSVHSFPHRSEFVAIGEHAGWRQPLRIRCRHRDAEPITMAQLTSFGRGPYESMQAGLCWGMIDFLATQYPGSLAGILGDLCGRRVGRNDWQRPDAGDASAEDQLEIIERHTSRDCLDEARRFFAGGCRRIRHRSLRATARKHP